MSESALPWRGPAAVLLVTESLRAGGLSIYARSMRRGLAAAGLAPRLISPDAPPAALYPPDETAAVQVFPGLHGGLLRPFVLRRLLAWARGEPFALVHGLSAFTWPVCQRLAGALGVGFVLSVQHYQDRGLALHAASRCRAVLACSEPIRENLVNDARVPKELIHVVPLGVEIPESPPAAESAAERWPVIATCAPLTPQQDVATFIRAAALVAGERQGACQFLVVGEGPEETRLRRLARELKLDQRLAFVHAAVPHEKVLPEVDVYAQTARREGFGLAVLEAMAWGRPVVATSVGGLISLVRDGQTGYLAPAGDAAAVARKSLDLLGDPALRARLGQAGRELALRQFALPRMIEGTLKVYARALKE
jgi:glycosyltransferase involved in cell wall biosynthesis